MLLNDILLFIFLFLSILNLIILFFTSIFLVRLRSELVRYLDEYLTSIPQIDKKEEKSIKSTTWDQKYEEELEIISNRIRSNIDGEL